MEQKRYKPHLIEFCHSGDIENAIRAMNEGADVNGKGIAGSSALKQASMRGHLPIMLALIERGANVNVADATGRTPLHWSCGGNHLQAVSLLISHGAHVNARALQGSTPLHWPCERGHQETVLMLIRQGANLNQTGEYHKTPLDLAALGGHTQIALALIAHGAICGEENKKVRNLKIAGMTQGQAAVRAGMVDRVKEILESAGVSHANSAEGPHALANLAKKHNQPEVLAVIQAHLAMRAIDGMVHAASAAAPAQQRSCTS